MVAVEHISLGTFIRDNVELIVGEWLSFARTRTPASDGMTVLELRDHIEEILDFLADDLESPQSRREQVVKSQGEGPKEGGAGQSAAEIHAALRLSDGFDIDQMVSEYRALRASVTKLWSTRNNELIRQDFNDLTRFNEAIDQATAESVNHYTKSLDRSRNLFLGILGHDLINPLGAALMSAEMMAQVGPLNAKQTTLAAQITACTMRASGIVTDLLDLTRVQFVSELPIVKERMDLALWGRQLIEEMRALYPGRDITLEASGDTEGEWDKSRMGQVFSNLIGNAIEHGSGDSAVDVTVDEKAEEVTLSFRNEGKSIPADKIGAIFESLVRGEERDEEQAGSAHLGLGLFITRKIVEAHQGSIGVTSSDRAGTTFTVRLPRQA